jgi:hypothetical protein
MGQTPHSRWGGWGQCYVAPTIFFLKKKLFYMNLDSLNSLFLNHAELSARDVHIGSLQS